MMIWKSTSHYLRILVSTCIKRKIQIVSFIGNLRIALQIGSPGQHCLGHGEKCLLEWQAFVVSGAAQKPKSAPCVKWRDVWCTLYTVCLHRLSINVNYKSISQTLTIQIIWLITIYTLKRPIGAYICYSGTFLLMLFHLHCYINWSFYVAKTWQKSSGVRKVRLKAGGL